MSSVAERRRKRKLANAIKAAEPKPAPDMTPPKPPQPPVRDGLEVLAKKGKLTAAREQAGRYYRGLFRDPGGAAIKSSLNFESIATAGCARGGFGGGLVEGSLIDARAELAYIRVTVLSSHGPMIEVLDEVCGKGRTLWDMANENERDASRLEERLKVALDLVAGYLNVELGMAA